MTWNKGHRYKREVGMPGLSPACDYFMDPSKKSLLFSKISVSAPVTIPAYNSSIRKVEAGGCPV
jgi:hypothetical protein